MEPKTVCLLTHGQSHDSQKMTFEQSRHVTINPSDCYNVSNTPDKCCRLCDIRRTTFLGVKFSFYSQMLDMGRCAVCLHPIILTEHKRFLSRFSQRIDWPDVTRDNSTPVKIFTAPSSTFHLLIMQTQYYTIYISRLWHPNPIKVTKENWSSRRAGNVSFSFFFSFFKKLSCSSRFSAWQQTQHERIWQKKNPEDQTVRHTAEEQRPDGKDLESASCCHFVKSYKGRTFTISFLILENVFDIDPARLTVLF